MSNVLPFCPTEFVNIHGKPVRVTMKQLVRQVADKAWCHQYAPMDPALEVRRALFTIRVPGFVGEPPEHQAYIGSGATEEGAWRDAYFRIVEAK